MSILRVITRVSQNGHDVDKEKLVARFPRTQQAIGAALTIADAAILADNSREPEEAFTVSRVQLKEQVVYDLRAAFAVPPAPILRWLSVVAP